MKKPKQPTLSEIEKEINSLITIDLPERKLYDIVQVVDEFCTNSYKQGLRDGKGQGYINGKLDAFDDDNAVEKVCTEYVAAQFSDCKTLSDFQEKFNEIRNRSYNFM